jgi:hypothetical protein
MLIVYHKGKKVMELRHTDSTEVAKMKAVTLLKF